MKSIESTYLTSLYFSQELLHFRDAYQINSIGFFDFFMKLKPHLIALNNSKDFLDGVSFYIKDNKTICSHRAQITQHLECCKYLRNKICGHLDNEFCAMAQKWEPTSLLKLSSDILPEKERRGRVELYVKALIESAINSFRIDNPSQSFFNNEIDIFYPPSYKEFMNFIGYTNDNTIQILSDIAKHLQPQINFYDGLEGALNAIYEASQMNFGSKKK